MACNTQTHTGTLTCTCLQIGGSRHAEACNMHNVHIEACNMHYYRLKHAICIIVGGSRNAEATRDEEGAGKGSVDQTLVARPGVCVCVHARVYLCALVSVCVIHTHMHTYITHHTYIAHTCLHSPNCASINTQEAPDYRRMAAAAAGMNDVALGTR